MTPDFLLRANSALIGLAMIIGSGAASAQSTHALSSAEEGRAIAAERQSSEVRLGMPASGADRGIPALANTPAGREGKSVVVSVAPVGSESTVARQGVAAPAGTASTRRAVVTRFNYATGVTTRTWVDVADGKTLAVRSDVNYPTPLAAAELDEAKSLLRAKVPEFDRALTTAGANAEYYHLVPVSNDPASPRFGHRVVLLWLAKPIHSEKYLVDLSTKDVEKAP